MSQELSLTGGKLVAVKCDVSKEEDILMMSADNIAGLGCDALLLSGSIQGQRKQFYIGQAKLLEAFECTGKGHLPIDTQANYSYIV